MMYLGYMKRGGACSALWDVEYPGNCGLGWSRWANNTWHLLLGYSMDLDLYRFVITSLGGTGFIS